MATILQRIGSVFGAGNSQPLVSAESPTQGSTDVAFSLDEHHTGAGAQQILIADTGGSTLVAASDQRALLLGGAGDDHLTGGSQADLLVGGGGANVMTGNEGADTFAHSAGAKDVITDFAPESGEHIAVQQGLTLVGSSHGTVGPGDFGLSGDSAQALTLNFSDGSQVILLHNDTPAADSSWLI